MILAPAAPALASEPESSISDELSVAGGQTDPHNPRGGQVQDVLSASVAAGSGWSVDLSAGVTAVKATSGVAGQEYGSRGGNATFFSPGVTWEATDHLTFGLALDYSPLSRLRTDTTVAYRSTTGPVDVDALLAVRTEARGASLSASWDSAGDSDWETGVDLDAGATHFDAEQHILAMRDPTTGASVTDQQMLAYCSLNPCSRQLLGLLRARATPLEQVSLRAGVVETIHRDTDLGLHWTAFLYDRDPTEVGFYGLTAAGRGPGFGSGLPLAPLRWSLRPEVAHRFGDLTARLWVEHGLYVDDEGVSDLVGLKLQVRLSPGFKAWIAGTWQRDRGSDGTVTTFNRGTLGCMALF